MLTRYRFRRRGRAARRRGFSMIEIMVTLVLLGIVGTALTRLLVFQGRAMDRQVQTRAARAVARNGINVMLADLRMTQDTLGIDSLATNGKSISVRVPYRFGLICQATAARVVASMLPVDTATLAQASYGGYAFRSSTTGAYTYVPSIGSLPAASATPTTCTGAGVADAQISTLTVNGRTGAVVDLLPGVTTPRVATPVFFWQRVTYSFAGSTAYPGRVGLWRRVGAGAAEELMAPFDSSARFRFYFLMDDTSRTSVTLADTTRIKGVDVVLTGSSPTKPFGSNDYQKSQMITSVFFRNTRH